MNIDVPSVKLPNWVPRLLSVNKQFVPPNAKLKFCPPDTENPVENVTVAPINLQAKLKSVQVPGNAIPGNVLRAVQFDHA